MKLKQYFVFSVLFVLMHAPVWASTPGHEAMVHLPGARFALGANSGPADEQPVTWVELAPFAIDRSPVTVAAFRKFVRASGHQTTAEELGDSAVFDMATGRWSLQPGATWAKPQGPERAPAPDDHPVTQVSWFDARAYCEAKNKRLPSEAEWEYAARNGSNSPARYAFGDRVVEDGVFLANVFTGLFPSGNDGADGYVTTSPVGVYGKTPLGLTDMAGNVWEWVADWYAPYSHRAVALSDDGGRYPEKVQRGGSFLCAAEVCHGYRTTARGHSTPGSSHMHVGFRCALGALGSSAASGRANAGPGLAAADSQQALGE